MVNKTINDLTAATAVATGDLFEIEQSSASKKATIEHIRAAVLAPRGALVRIASSLPAQNYSGAITQLNFPSGSEVYDTDTIHDDTTNNSRLTVPSGVSWVKMSGQIRTSSVASANWIFGVISKSTSIAYIGCPCVGFSMSTNTSPGIGLVSAPLSVTPGDYFELEFQCQDNSITIEADSWFCMEILA